MANQELLRLSIAELAPKIGSGEVSPVEVTVAALERAEALQPKLNSFITLMKDQAMAQAETEQAAVARGEYKGPLQGIPVGIKDNLATAACSVSA
jgi:aspartyl-tRNA(Asn)/glutamyl-tRNA(Gln) amidotransferase subunit A